MRIAFVGKGGSGKTTTCALFARYLASHKHNVLAFDADINQHLASALGMDSKSARQLQPLGTQQDRIKSYLAGTNSRVTPEDMAKTTPPGQGSHLLTLHEQNPLSSYFERSINGVRLMAAGEITKDDVGARCYHGKTGAIDLLLSHILDGKEDYIVVDMTAGADAFSSGLFLRVDVVCLVVEPTEKSLSVYDQLVKYGADHELNFVVVGNKIEDKDDMEYIYNRVGNSLLTTIHRSQYVKALDRGLRPDFNELETSTREALATLQAYCKEIPRNWDALQRRSIEIHRQNAEKWLNDSVGQDMNMQIDVEFSLAQAAALRNIA
jgi:CO dehydrogenase maturation factor